MTDRLSIRYLNEFMRMKCAPELLARRIFPNAKEITESMGAWHAVREHVLPRVPVLRNDPNVLVHCVGDGTTPRTGALFAFLSRWQVYSIDPRMRDSQWKVARLHTFSERIEDFFNQGTSPLNLIVHVHSHASLQASVNNLTSVGGGCRYLVNIPCCRKADLDMEPIAAYNDPAILSPRNRVEVYDLNGI